MKTSRGLLRTPQRISQARTARKSPGPACCPDCGAILRRGRWRWEEIPAAPRAQQCPACWRMRTRDPAASVTLSGEFLAEHRDEILARVRACERAENRDHPLQRIIELRGGARDVRVTTTDQHLARRIGDALVSAYKGELEYRYNEKDDLLRVTWSR